MNYRIYLLCRSWLADWSEDTLCLHVISIHKYACALWCSQRKPVFTRMSLACCHSVTVLCSHCCLLNYNISLHKAGGLSKPRERNPASLQLQDIHRELCHLCSLSSNSILKKLQKWLWWFFQYGNYRGGCSRESLFSAGHWWNCQWMKQNTVVFIKHFKTVECAPLRARIPGNSVMNYHQMPTASNRHFARDRVMRSLLDFAPQQ